jgi:glucosamine--fructose-6-phosphate aminotransferase (isomerizing)
MDHGPSTGQHTLSEIRSQPQAWAAVVPAATSAEAAWRSFFTGQAGCQYLLFGCGSTFYLSLTAAAVLQTVTGSPCRAVPSSELLFYEEAWIASGLDVRGLAISRSGTTTETLRALERLSDRKDARLAAVTCHAGTPMETWCSPVLVSPEGYETSIAQTRSFASMLVGCLEIAGIASGRVELLDALAGLPPIGQHLLDEYEGLAAALGGDASLQRVFFLGSGARFGLACEGMLKMKEMSLTSSEAYHFLEFRHGPKSMVDSSTMVVGLLSDAARGAEMQVLREMKELGARLLVLSESDHGLVWADAVVPFGSGLPEVARLPLYLPVLQLLAYHRAVSKGLDPDAPRNLDAVVKLDSAS